MQMNSHRTSPKPSAVLCVFLLLMFILGGCAFRTPQDEGVPPPPGEDKPALELIAVLPVIDRVGDARASEMLRHEVLQHLYFKGYPEIPLAYIDERLETMAVKRLARRRGTWRVRKNSAFYDAFMENVENTGGCRRQASCPATS